MINCIAPVGHTLDQAMAPFHRLLPSQAFQASMFTLMLTRLHAHPDPRTVMASAAFMAWPRAMRHVGVRQPQLAQAGMRAFQAFIIVRNPVGVAAALSGCAAAERLFDATPQQDTAKSVAFIGGIMWGPRVGHMLQRIRLLA